MLKIRLIETGKHKIEVVKLIRLFTKLGLRESKELMDNAPSVLVSHNDDISIEQIKKNFQAIGAIVEEIKEAATHSPPVSAAGVDDSQIHNKHEPTKRILKDYDKKPKPEEETAGYKPINKQKTLLKSAITFALVTALIKSFLSIHFGYLSFYLIFIVAVGVAFFLRKKNPIANKALGMTAFAITMLYFFASIFSDLIIFYVLYQYIIPFNPIRIVASLFTSMNFLVLVAAFLSYFLASNKNIFKNYSENSKYPEKREESFMKSRHIKDHKKKKKF